ncbi:hypothetical protein CVT24_010714 [Panaeolus cyanescens]|uniref:Protein kinase domain-containing protein n=1 Tax=Panaeolus cyanescens TaxID=181874 RepID=A0A409YNI3_9AGAR|nr:hypothetical protein CVT24_010714 [Panaeolus cyanescens]
MPHLEVVQDLEETTLNTLDQYDSSLSPLPQRTRGLSDPVGGRHRATSYFHESSPLSALPPSQLRPQIVTLKRSMPQISLKPLYIPTPSKLGSATSSSNPNAAPSAPSSFAFAVPKLEPAAEHEITPVSESPITPSSMGNSSIIAGVVDLTRFVKTVSEFPVAQGGLSDIYQGEWEKRSEDEPWKTETVKVAIKVLRFLTMRDPDGVRMRKRLNREVYVWHRLEHPNVVKLFGTSYHMASRPAMIMQWYKNGSAADYLARKNPGADRLQLILDVARGLAYLHTHQPPIVHADLKGNNVLITDEGRAVLCDFGLSNVIEGLGRPEGMTLSSPDFGPLRWQGPEFMDEDYEQATLASDVWSYGCTAFELLTGRLPYGHRTRDAQVIADMQLRRKPPGPAAVSLLAFDSRVRDLLDMCWSFEPEMRPKMTEVVQRLEEICAIPLKS